MLNDPSIPDFTAPGASQAVIPLICPIEGGLDSVTGPMNLPVGVSAGSDATYLNDGSFLLAGNTTDASNAPVLIHYNADGSLDSSFGTSGYLSGPAGGSELSATQLSNGEFLVSSQVSNQDGSTSEYAAEFTGVGLLDTSFGGGSGQLIAPDGTNLNGVPQVMNDGSFLVSANTTDGSNTPVIVGYTSTGDVNYDFGTNGEIVAPAGVSSEWFYQDSTSGDIVVNDFTSQNDGSFTDQTTFYTTTGQLDPSNPSVATTIIPDIGSGYYGTDNLTAPTGYTLDGGWQTLQDGTTLASGFSSDGSNTPVLVDYNADGSINSSFGNNGTIIGTPGTDYQYTYQDSNSGEIVFKQFANQADGSISEVDTYYTTTGQLDSSNPSVATTIIPDPIAIDPISVDPLPIIDPVPLPPMTGSGYYGTDNLTAPSGYTLDGGWLTLQDGTAIASGSSSDGNYTPILVDYNADGSINTAFGNNGQLTGPPGSTYLWANQTDSGAIQIKGAVLNSDGSYNFFLEQFTSSGQLDTSFGGGSGSLTAPDGVTFNGDFILLGNGDILAGALSTEGKSTPMVVDYTSSGVVNSAFGNNGEIIAPAGVTSEWFYQEGDQYGGNGDIVVFDHTDNADGSVTDLTTYYLKNGQVDPNSPAMTITYDAPIYYADGSYDRGNITTYPVDVFPVVMMDSGVRTDIEAKSVTLRSENTPSTPHVATSQATEETIVPVTTASNLIVTPTFIPAAVTTVSTANTHSAVYPVTSLQNDLSSGAVVPDVVQSSYDLGSSTAIASISALKLAASAENRRDPNSSEDENADLAASQDSTPFQIKQDLLEPSSTPKSEDMTMPAGTEADLPDQQEEGKNNVASVTQKDVSPLLARNNLVTTISLGLPDFLQ